MQNYIYPALVTSSSIELLETLDKEIVSSTNGTLQSAVGSLTSFAITNISSKQSNLHVELKSLETAKENASS